MSPEGSGAIINFSDLLRSPVLDERGQGSYPVDLAVDLDAADYPPVTHLLVPGKETAVSAVAWTGCAVAGREIRVPALSDAHPLDDDALVELVLLRRDILDALVLDLAGLQAVRANGLWLRETDGELVLAGVDVSPWAVLRRLARGRLVPASAESLLDWNDVEFLRGDPRAAAAGRDYHRRVAHLNPVQIARLTDALPYPHAAELLLLLPCNVAADVLEHMLPERQVQVVAELHSDQAVPIVAEMADDAAADLLGRLELDDAARLLEALPPQHSEALQYLLRFPPDTAGGIMTNEVVTAPVGLTVAGVLDHIRPQLARPDFVYFVYVVDDEARRRLRGVVTLRDLLLADPDAPIEAVMRADLEAVGALEPAIEVAHRVADYALNAVPVVDGDKRLLGIVTVDKAMAQITPEGWRDRLPRIFS